MGQKEKLIRKLKSGTRSFTYNDTIKLLSLLSYEISSKGKTSGSRVMFVSSLHPPILLHRPHPQKELPEYQVADYSLVRPLLRPRSLSSRLLRPLLRLWWPLLWLLWSLLWLWWPGGLT